VTRRRVRRFAGSGHPASSSSRNAKGARRASPIVDGVGETCEASRHQSNIGTPIKWLALLAATKLGLDFGSSLAAVEAAFELAETCEPKVRIGVHLGDVVLQPNGDLLGHGVNVAARLMAQASPGAVLVSAAVRQTIRGPIADRLQSRGMLKLDKMAETIEAFALTGAALAPGATPPTHAEPILTGSRDMLTLLPFVVGYVHPGPAQAIEPFSPVGPVARKPPFELAHSRRSDFSPKT
jgi:hypothetical protein